MKRDWSARCVQEIRKQEVAGLTSLRNSVRCLGAWTGLEAAAVPQHSLRSIVMSQWKESGRRRARRGSDGFHKSFHPEQSWASGVWRLWPVLMLPIPCLLAAPVILTLRLAKSKSRFGKCLLAWHSKAEWFDGEKKKDLSLISRHASLVVNYVRAASQVMHCGGICWRAVTLNLLSWLSDGDHGGQYPSLWWLFSHNHVCFWRDQCFPENLLPN